jgi:CRP/FNR family transcriptional regulator
MSSHAAWAQILPGTRDALEAMCRIKSYAAGQIIVQEGENAEFVGHVLKGVLRLQKSLANGRQHIVGLLVEGDIFGGVSKGSAEFSIEAATQAEFCLFPRVAFESLLMQSPDLERAVLLNFTNELDRAREWMVILSSQKIVGRIAGFLLLMCARYSSIDHYLQPRPNGMEVKIPISRIDLANLLGTRPESISRALHALSDQGYIEILAPNRILIKDSAALAEAADEDADATAPVMRNIIRDKRLGRLHGRVGDPPPTITRGAWAPEIPDS